MASEGQPDESVARRYAVLRPYLDERQRRLLLGAEVAELGRGGIKAVALATGVHPDTVAKGVRELEGGVEPAGRVRAPGGGRKPATENDPGLAPALRALVDPQTRGIRPRRWCGRRSRPVPWPTRWPTAGIGCRTGRSRGCCAPKGSACRPTPRSARAASTSTGT